MIVRRTRRSLALAAIAVVLLAACGDDDDTGDATAEETTADEGTSADAESVETESTDGDGTVADETDTTTAATDASDATEGTSGDSADEPEASEPASAGGIQVNAGEPFPEARCAANEQAGTITFLTGFDFAAAASIIEVVVAEDRGYYEDLCLDVEVRPSFSTANYPIVASGEAQFASGGSFGEVVAFAEANDADLIAVSVDARAPIDALIVKPGEADTIEDLRGTTIGVKGRLPTSLEVMLGDAGLTEGTDYETVLIDGFDPLAHIALPDIVGFSAWKSNEPGTLERAGVDFDLIDPLAEGVPGSFGVIFTSLEFVAEHPTAAEDFVRATMRGLADAVDDPAAAATTAVDLINETGNPNFLSPEGETFRWTSEVDLILETTPEGAPLGVPDDISLQEELDAAAEVGLFGDAGAPSAAALIGADITAGIYDSEGQVIWPS